MDAHNGLVYVTATFGNSIMVWDRETLRSLGSIVVGGGGRNADLSEDGRRLFSSALGRHYVWETEALARRFHPGAKP